VINKTCSKHCASLVVIHRFPPVDYYEGLLCGLPTRVEQVTAGCTMFTTRSTVTLQLHCFNLLWIRCTTCSYTTVGKILTDTSHRVTWSVRGSRASCSDTVFLSVDQYAATFLDLFIRAESIFCQLLYKRGREYQTDRKCPSSMVWVKIWSVLKGCAHSQKVLEENWGKLNNQVCP